VNAQKYLDKHKNVHSQTKTIDTRDKFVDFLKNDVKKQNIINGSVVIATFSDMQQNYYKLTINYVKTKITFHDTSKMTNI
jgi:hypothetical protein